MPSVPEYEQTLLHIAMQDLRAAELLAGDSGCDDETVGFHCQQALEKALKAVLERRRIEFPLTHDLVLLLESVVAGDDPCPVGMDDARRLWTLSRSGSATNGRCRPLRRRRIVSTPCA